MRLVLSVSALLLTGCSAAPVSSPLPSPSTTVSPADPTSTPPPVTEPYLSVDRYKKCMTFVGISATQAITVSVKDPSVADHCVTTHRIAETVLRHLR